MGGLRTPVGICAALVCSLALAAPAQADFTVNNLGDLDDFDSGVDGICEVTSGGDDCTLRAAITEANATPALDNITFSVSGTHMIGSTLTVTEETVIDGNGPGSGAGNTIVDGMDAVRLFLVSGAPSVTFKDMLLANGGLAAPDVGAGIRTDSPVTLTNATVSGSQITGVGNGGGAGIAGTDAAATITLTSSRASSNIISSTGVNTGAGISSQGALSITDSFLSGNNITAGTSRQGGGIAANGAFDLTRVTLRQNSVTALGEGGGIFGGANPGVRQIVNSTISGNTGGALVGGGGADLSADTTLTNVTFTENTGGSGAGGQGDDLEVNAGMVTAQNTIFNSAEPCEDNGTGSILSASPGNNIDEGTTCAFATGSPGFNQVSTNPMLTGFVGTDNVGTHPLLPGSPAINMADAGCGGGLMTDQRGVTRPQGPVCDVGAFELEHVTLTVTPAGSGTGTITGTGISCPGDCTELVPRGTMVTLTAAATGSSTFAGWTGCDVVGGNQCTQNLSGGNETVTATFTAPATPPATTPPTTTTPTTPTTRKCPKGKKLKKGKCVKKKRKKK